MVGNGAGAGKAEADAAGQARAGRGVQRGIGDGDADAGAGGGRLNDAAAIQAHVHAVDGEARSIAEVGEQEYADHVAIGQHARGGADAALPAQARHARARADAALIEFPACARLLQGAAHIIEGHVHRTRIRQPGVIALAHHGDDHITECRLTPHEDLACRVVDPADLHGGGEEDRRLGVAPLLDLRAPGELARTIEHGDAGGHRVGNAVTSRIDHGDARARDTAAGRGGGLVVHDGGMPDPDTGHVDDARGGTAREGADGDAEIRDAHSGILSGRDRLSP